MVELSGLEAGVCPHEVLGRPVMRRTGRFSSARVLRHCSARTMGCSPALHIPLQNAPARSPGRCCVQQQPPCCALVASTATWGQDGARSYRSWRGNVFARSSAVERSCKEGATAKVSRYIARNVHNLEHLS